MTVNGAVVHTIHMSLDGKRLKDPGKAVFKLAIHASGLKAGKHRLTITAADKFKNPTRSFTDFRVCA